MLAKIGNAQICYGNIYQKKTGLSNNYAFKADESSYEKIIRYGKFIGLEAVSNCFFWGGIFGCIGKGLVDLSETKNLSDLLLIAAGIIFVKVSFPISNYASKFLIKK